MQLLWTETPNFHIYIHIYNNVPIPQLLRWKTVVLISVKKFLW